MKGGREEGREGKGEGERGREQLILLPGVYFIFGANTYRHLYRWETNVRGSEIDR